MARIHLSIVTPTRHLIDREVDEVTAPGIYGEFGVLPDHDLFLISLVPGVVEFVDGPEKGQFAVSSGFAEVGHDRINILAETAEEAGEIDAVRAAKAKEEAEASLMRELTEQELEDARKNLEVAVARLAAVEKGEKQ